MRKTYALLALIFLVGFSTNSLAQCTSCSLSGPSSMQTNSTATFSTSGLSGTSYFWSVTGGLQLMSGNTGTSVTVKAVSGTSGRICIARYGNGKVPCSYCKTVSIVNTTCTLTSVSVVRTSGNCNSSTFTYRATPNGSNLSGVSYSWQALGTGMSITSGQGTNIVTIQSNNSNPIFVGARATVTACGTTKSGVSAELCEEPDCGDFICRINTAPNPSKDGFTVMLNKGEKALISRVSPEFTIQLLNKDGKVVKEVKTQDSQVFMDTRDLNNGVYIIRALHASGQSKTETVIINK